MLVRAIKRVIENGQTEGLAEKLEAFRKANTITEDQYAELIGMLPK